MQNVGALRRLGECSTRCHLKMWPLGMLWYWDTWNAGKGRRHWNYFDKCNSIVCNQTLLLLLGCWMHVPAWLQLKRAGVFISRSLNGWDSDVFVGSSLVDTYAKCGSMEDAGSVFNKSPHAWQIQVTKFQGCSCRTAEIVRTCVWCRVRALCEIGSEWCGRRRNGISFVTTARNWLLHLGSSTQLLVVLSKWGKNLWVCEDCHTSSIPFITLKMVMPVICLVNHDIKFILFTVWSLLIL